jgi:hypothetical protein
MTTWPTVDDRDVTHLTPGEAIVDALDFLLWLLTGHIRHDRPAPVVRNTIASRAWADPPSGRCNLSR